MGSPEGRVEAASEAVDHPQGKAGWSSSILSYRSPVSPVVEGFFSCGTEEMVVQKAAAVPISVSR
jgi:hypothetical protein